MSRPHAQSFDDFATSYDRRDELNGGFLTAWLRGVLVGRHGASALDLGCGTGRVAGLLAAQYDQVLAVDLSEQMLGVARSRRSHPRVTYALDDLSDVTGRYDLVVSVMVLHHVPDLPRALDHIAELVAPGGLALLIDATQSPKPRWKWYAGNVRNLVWDLRARTPDAWERFRLNCDPHWIDHLVHDRFLSPEDFISVYSTAYPGAVVAPLGGLYTVAWEKPQSASTASHQLKDGLLLG